MAERSPSRGPSVLMVAVSWPAETFLLRTILEVAKLGARITLCVATRPGEPAPVIPGVRVIQLRSLATNRWKLMVGTARQLMSKFFVHPIRTLQFSRAYGRSSKGLVRMLPLVAERFDVVHFQWNASAVEYEPLFELLRAPAVVSCRGSQVNVAPHNPRRDAFVGAMRRTLRKAAAVHCVSDAIASKVVAMGIDPRAITVIRPALDTSFFAVRPEPESRPFRILMVGNLSWVKGYEYALMAIDFLRREGHDVVLDIVGTGLDRQRIQFTINDLGLTNSVSLLGRLSPEGVRNTLGQAHAFVLSSVSEGIPNAMLEAMACGVAVVAADCAGVLEVVSSGENGIVVPRRDPDAIARALQTLILDSSLRERLGEAARETILSRHSLVDQAEKFFSLYSRLAAR